MTRKAIFKALATALVAEGFRDFEGKSLSYTTRYNEVTVSLDRGCISVVQRCYPMKEGWCMKDFKKTKRGISAVVKFAKANMTA